MPKITFVFQGEERCGEFDESTSLLSAALQLDVPIISTCGGQPSCTDCRVKIVEGFEHLNSTEFAENNLMGTVSHITKVRLACQAKTTGDVRAEVQRVKGVALKTARVESEEKRLERRERAKQELKRFSENAERDRKRKGGGAQKKGRSGGRRRGRGRGRNKNASPSGN